MSTAGYVKLLLPPRQSRGNSYWGLGRRAVTVPPKQAPHVGATSDAPEVRWSSPFSVNRETRPCGDPSLPRSPSHYPLSFRCSTCPARSPRRAMSRGRGTIPASAVSPAASSPATRSRISTRRGCRRPPSRTASRPMSAGSKAASPASPIAPSPAPRSSKSRAISRPSSPKPASRRSLACDTDACGGIPFTEAIDALPIPQMWVDGFNYRYYAGRKTEGGRETYASVAGQQEQRRHLCPADGRRGRRHREQDGRRRRHGEGARREGPHRALRHLFRHRQGGDQAGEPPDAGARLRSCCARSRSSTSFIVGHTDSQGTFDYNLDLSRRRAEAVAAELAQVLQDRAARACAPPASASSRRSAPTPPTTAARSTGAWSWWRRERDEAHGRPSRRHLRRRAIRAAAMELTDGKQHKSTWKANVSHRGSLSPPIAEGCWRQAPRPSSAHLDLDGRKARRQRAARHHVLRSNGVHRRQHSKAASKGRHSVPRAFLRGALDSIMSPVKGRPSSKIRKIAEAAEKANNERQVKSVMFRGEKRL